MKDSCMSGRPGSGKAPMSTSVVTPTLAEYASASMVPRFLSSKVWMDRSAFNAATEGAFAAMSPVALTSIPFPAKNALPNVLVAAGPVNAWNTSTG